MGRFDGIVEAYMDEPHDEAERAELIEYAERALARRLRHSGKTCSRCEGSKQLNAFGALAASRDGLRPECRVCRP